MQRQTRTNLMLLGMVLLLCAAAMAELKREEWHLPRPVAVIDARTVQVVKASCANCADRRFEKSQGRWWMRQPYDLPASGEAVQRLLSIASAPARKRHAATEFEAKKLGLDPPQAVLEMGAVRLEFGVTDTINDDRYVRYKDEVVLVPDRFSAWLFAPAENELDRHFLSPVAPLRDVVFDGLSRPDLLTAWTQLEAKRIVKTSDATAPGGEMHLIELVENDGARRAWTIWHVGADYFAKRGEPELVYVFDEASAQQLLAKLPAGVK
jgi:hypothetical protein